MINAATKTAQQMEDALSRVALNGRGIVQGAKDDDRSRIFVKYQAMKLALAQVDACMYELCVHYELDQLERERKNLALTCVKLAKLISDNPRDPKNPERNKQLDEAFARLDEIDGKVVEMNPPLRKA